MNSSLTPRYICGIDLGTSTSAIAFVDHEGKARVVEDENGKAIIPSAVKFCPQGEMKIGKEALSCASTGTVITSVKRLIGKQYDEVTDRRLPYAVLPSPDGIGILLQANDQTMRPEGVSALLIGHLIDRANKVLFDVGQGRVEEAVVTIPAGFNASQKASTRTAALQAGLKRVTFLQEPVAAAMAYGHGKETDFDTILVFDLGGGTLDLSLVESFEGIMEVIASEGEEVGGDDFTSVALEALIEALDGSAGLAATRKPEIQSLLWNEAERIKIDLTSSSSVELMPLKLPPLHKELTTSAKTITREEFDARSGHLIARLWAPLQKLAVNARLQLGGSLPYDLLELGKQPTIPGFSLFPSQTEVAGKIKFSASPRRLSSLVFVGAATRMPSVRRFVEQVTGLRAAGGIDPEEAVVIGAAIHAGILQGTLSSSIELTDGSYNTLNQGRTTDQGSWQP